VGAASSGDGSGDSGEVVQGDCGVCGEGRGGYGESRGEDALPERGGEGDFPASPAEPLRAVPRCDGGY